jgi:hypothetical protein
VSGAPDHAYQGDQQRRHTNRHTWGRQAGFLEVCRHLSLSCWSGDRGGLDGHIEGGQDVAIHFSGALDVRQLLSAVVILDGLALSGGAAHAAKPTVNATCKDGTTYSSTSKLAACTDGEAHDSGKVVVRATDVIFAAGNQGQFAAQAGGTVPQAVIDIPSTAKGVSIKRIVGSIDCYSAGGCVTVDGGETYHDPDGFPTGFDDSTGWDSISGISAPGQGYLVGVFLAQNGPSGAAPVALSYSQKHEQRRVFHPLLDQAFFIGDGLTGDGSGTRQVFKVPQGATQLVLGINDACGGQGVPACYNDNKGKWIINYKIKQ